MFGRVKQLEDVIYQRHECSKLCCEVEVKRSLKSEGRWAAYRWDNPMVSLRCCPSCGEVLEVVRDAEGN